MLSVSGPLNERLLGKEPHLQQPQHQQCGALVHLGLNSDAAGNLYAVSVILRLEMETAPRR
jgi:hypothetical protein